MRDLLGKPVPVAAIAAAAAVIVVLGWFAVTPRLSSGHSAHDQAPAARRSTGWLVTVYYTAVESFHHGNPTNVTGCPSLDCSHGHDNLGTYPGSFVAAVREEGSGRLTSGAHAGRYLNWSSNVGYWLDSAPRDSYGRPLQAFRSAASDTLSKGTAVRLVDCGQNHGQVPRTVCKRLEAGHWQIRDQFTPGYGGPQHIDLYIGEENEPNFTRSPTYSTLHQAALLLG